MTHCQAIGSKVNESPAAITRFNEAKRKNVEERKVCGPDKLVLYRVPEARPAKAVVPALGDDQSESGYSTSMDGLDGVLRGFGRGAGVPANPVVPLSMLQSPLPASLPCLSLQEPFGSMLFCQGEDGAMIKTLESRNTKVLADYAGQYVMIRIGTKP